jgi:transcriptional regulator of acetoin/glycerol metabolism
MANLIRMASSRRGPDPAADEDKLAVIRLLFEVHGWSVPRIARVLKVSRPTVWRRVGELRALARTLPPPRAASD